jgi:hypothetical protein
LYQFLFAYINNKQTLQDYTDSNDVKYFSLYMGKLGKVTAAICQALALIDAEQRFIAPRNDFFVIVPVQSAVEKLAANQNEILALLRNSWILENENIKLDMNDVERQSEPTFTPKPF